MKYTTTYRLVLRILVVPFVLGVMLITYNAFILKRLFNFIRYGGEFIRYDNPNDIKSIQDIFNELKKQNEKN